LQQDSVAVFGSSGSDTVVGSVQADLVLASSGNDGLQGGAGAMNSTAGQVLIPPFTLGTAAITLFLADLSPSLSRTTF
jgi:hypothetical protein